jgi:ParB family chromosome partitioning protein
VSEKRRRLGRGLGALIPSEIAPLTRPVGDRPIDVYFPENEDGADPTLPDPHGELPTRVIGRSPLIGGPPVPAPVSRGGAPARSVEGLGLPSVPGADDTSAAPGTGTPPLALTRPEEHGAADPPLSPPRTRRGGTPSGAADGLVPVPGATFAELPVDSIRPNPKQPRQSFDEESLAELVYSVKEIGILQPIVVRRTSGPATAGEGPVDGVTGSVEDGEPRYELVMGERRLRACREAGLDRIPAIVRDTHDDELLRDALLENLHRTQLNPLEEAAAYQQLLDDFGCTHEDLAGRIGRSRPQISNTLRLLKLPPLVQRRVASAVLSAGHARALLGLEDPAAMERLAQRIVAEGLSVRAVEEIVTVGDATTPPPAKRRPRTGNHRAELDDLASRIGDRLDTRVGIALGRKKGRLSIDFASVEDLNRILGLLSLDVKEAFPEE